MVQDIKEAKRQLRSLVKARGAMASETSQVSCDAAVLAMAQWKSARTVLLYSSIPGEVPTAGLIEAALREGKRVVLPLVVGDSLLLKEYSPDKMVPGYRGIMEPAPDSADVLPSEVELAVVPGVAFDRRCCRLGRGKGYYDRTLPSLDCSKLGLAFDWQIVDAVPSDEWDIPLDMVATPSFLYIRAL